VQPRYKCTDRVKSVCAVETTPCKDFKDDKSCAEAKCTWNAKAKPPVCAAGEQIFNTSAACQGDNSCKPVFWKCADREHKKCGSCFGKGCGPHGDQQVRTMLLLLIWGCSCCCSWCCSCSSC